MDGRVLLDEVMKICPSPVLELMKGLTGTLDPDLTQVRYMKIGPVKWWLQNFWRCPSLSKLLKGNHHQTDYMMSGVSIQITNLPIFSQLSNKTGLRFLELQFQMSLLTDYMLAKDQNTVHCKYYLRDSWTANMNMENAGGTLVSIVI